MFPLSSQKNYWLFNDENDLARLREETNAEFIAKHGAKMTVSFFMFIFYNLENHNNGRVRETLI